jgi:mannitol-specific phosphotransferase system IIBC component
MLKINTTGIIITAILVIASSFFAGYIFSNKKEKNNDIKEELVRLKEKQSVISELAKENNKIAISLLYKIDSLSLELDSLVNSSNKETVTLRNEVDRQIKKIQTETNDSIFNLAKQFKVVE